MPLLTLTAYYAPPGHRATWFALMASLMNIALVAGQLQTKYLNDIFVVGRGLQESTIIIFMTSVMVGMLGLLADLIVAQRREPR